MLHFVRSTWWMKAFFPSLTWEKPNSEKAIYLTFDDGPHPEITPWVMNQLEEVNAQASFFVIGENVERYPDTFQKLVQSKHSVGNHSYKHLSGWQNSKQAYLEDVNRCGNLYPFKLFRPPYGKIRWSQAKALNKRYEIIMWDRITYDFDETISPEQCFKNAVEDISSGSIIVFHDSEKAEKNLRATLPPVLQHLKKQGFELKAL